MGGNKGTNPSETMRYAPKQKWTLGKILKGMGCELAFED